MADKRQLAHIFIEIATLLELKGDNPFKIRAYQNASRILSDLTVSVDEFVANGGLESTKGLGKAIGQKIHEYIDTGKIGYYEELRIAVPDALFELIKIPGLGPKKALLLHEKLNINSIGELEYACRENRLVELPGFGTKTQQRMLEGIEYIKKFQGKFLLADVWQLAEKIAEYLRHQKGIGNAAVAGSIRRCNEVVRNIDIVVACDDQDAAAAVITGMPGIEKVITSEPAKVTVVLENGVRVDTYIVPTSGAAAGLLRFTGSSEHYRQLCQLAKNNSYDMDERGIMNKAGQPLVVEREQDVYRLLGLKYIEPELREGLTEIEAAQTERLPKLIGEGDIRGIFHVHTTYSDGSATVPVMAQAAKARGWQYLGVTDHSRTAVYARGLRFETILEQRREIAEFNAANPDVTVLAGIECDILPDGSLDYEDEILADFDFVIASVHSAFRQTEAEMTRRIVKAINNRYVSMLGHPTGRILTAREGYPLDLRTVIKAAADTGTIIEINASPYRLDIDWRWCRQAKELGVLLAINPDAHAVEELADMRYGVAVARKGWLSPEDIINTRDLKTALTLLQRKRA
jgi:DNA polymerase (family 10)